MDPLFKKTGEKWLFATLWGLLLLGFGLYRFWPTAAAAPDPIPDVVIGDELRYWFQSAAITETLPSHYGLSLHLSPDYRTRLDRKQLTVSLGFDLWGAHHVLYRGETPCLIRAEKPDIDVELPNPERITARKITLHLAH